MQIMQTEHDLENGYICWSALTSALTSLSTIFPLLLQWTHFCMPSHESMPHSSLFLYLIKSCHYHFIFSIKSSLSPVHTAYAAPPTPPFTLWSLTSTHNSLTCTSPLHLTCLQAIQSHITPSKVHKTSLQILPPLPLFPFSDSASIATLLTSLSSAIVITLCRNSTHLFLATHFKGSSPISICTDAFGCNLFYT